MSASFLEEVLLLLLLLSRFSHVRLCDPTRLPHLWDSPGKNTGVGCHFLLRYMKVKSEGEVAQSCLTLCDPMDCSLPGSSVHGIFQARTLEWGAIAFSIRRSELPSFHHRPPTSSTHHPSLHQSHLCYISVSCRYLN